MIRNFFVDFVVVCALSLVVWGVAPVLVAQTEPQIEPPYYEEGKLPEGTILKSGANTCCFNLGNPIPCSKKNDPETGLCSETPSCNSILQWWGCKCGSLAFLRSCMMVIIEFHLQLRLNEKVVGLTKKV